MMVTKFVMLTGVAGIGKSTIAQYIEKRIEAVVHLSFGDLIHEILQREGTLASRTEIRTRPDKFVPIQSIKIASEELIARVAKLRQTTSVIVETHAVIKDHYGFWIFPEIANFEEAKLDAIIVIHAPFELFEERMIKEPAGRNWISKQAFEKYQTLQDSVAINFSLRANCPMYIVETDNDIDKTSAILLQIFENIEMPFKRIIES